MKADGWDACQGEGCLRDRAAAYADGTIAIATATGTADPPPPPPPRPPGLSDDDANEPPPPPPPPATAGPPPQTLQQLQGIGKYGISMSYLDGYLLI